MSDYYQVLVRLQAGGAELKSPTYADEAAAKADLDAIRAAQDSGELVALPWLSVRGGEILAAQIVGRSLPRAF